MYASVRKYEIHPERVEEFMHRLDAQFAPRLERTPGFVAYQVIDGGLDRARKSRVGCRFRVQPPSSRLMFAGGCIHPEQYTVDNQAHNQPADHSAVYPIKPVGGWEG